MKITAAFFFSCSFLFVSYSVYSQKNLAAGYIITQSADTISGFIFDKNWDKNPSQIQFKPRLEDEFQTYTPTQIKAFYIPFREGYESHRVSIDTSPTELADMVPGAGNTTVLETVFLSVQLKSQLSLFYLKDEKEKSHYYIQRGKESPQELILAKHLFEYQGRKNMITEEVYKKQLTAYLADCPQLQAKIQKTRYSSKPLQTLILLYNQCTTKEPIQFQVPPEKFRLSLSALAGVSHTSLDFTGSLPAPLVVPAFSASTNYTFGVGFDLDLPKNHDKWAIYNELRWKSYQAKGTYDEIVDSERYTKSSLSFDLNYISLATLLRYRFGLGKLRTFINAGMVNSLSIGVKNTKTVESRLFSTYRTEQVKAIDDFRKHEQGLAVGFGMAWKRFTGELRYELGNGMSAYSSLRSTTKTASLLVAYRLN